MNLRWYSHESRAWQWYSNRDGEGWYIDSSTSKPELQYFDEINQKWQPVLNVVEVQDPGPKPEY